MRLCDAAIVANSENLCIEPKFLAGRVKTLLYGGRFPFAAGWKKLPMRNASADKNSMAALIR